MTEAATGSRSAFLVLSQLRTLLNSGSLSRKGSALAPYQAIERAGIGRIHHGAARHSGLIAKGEASMLVHLSRRRRTAAASAPIPTPEAASVVCFQVR
jgi:hypothetical protein